MIDFSQSELMRCLDLLSKVFPSIDASIVWLTLSNPRLGNKQPLLLMAEGNVQAVISILEKTEPKMVS